MPHLDRDSLIALLDRLGSSDDGKVLNAAREIDRRLRDAGVTWDDLLEDDLLVSSPARPAAPATEVDPDRAGFTGYAGAFNDDDVPDATRRTDGYPDDLALIDRMLAEYPLSDDTRHELLDFKTDIAEGEFTDMDSRYLRDLEARLSRRLPPTT